MTVETAIRCLIAGLMAGFFIAAALPARADDGCGRGWFYNGYRCAPYEAPRYRRYRRPSPPVVVEQPPPAVVVPLPSLQFNFR